MKNGNLVVDDQQSGNKWTFENISLSLRRPSGGGVALSVGEEGDTAVVAARRSIGPQVNGVRTVDIRADKVPTVNILLAMRLKDLTYSADLPLSGGLRGEIGRDGLPTYFPGKLAVDAGSIIDRDAPEYPMAIDRGRNQRRLGFRRGACWSRRSRSFPAPTASRCSPISSRRMTTCRTGSSA